MQIYPVDSKKNLFYVENAFPENFIESINSVDLNSYQYTKIHLQEDKPRKRLSIKDNDIFSAMYFYINDNIDVISKLIQKEIQSADTAVWYDSPGYNIGLHEDNSVVKIAMQIYLNKTYSNLGTTFFNENNFNHLDENNFNHHKRHVFDFIPNTGYIMINDKNQWHAMTQVVPKDTYRLTTYSYFY